MMIFVFLLSSAISEVTRGGKRSRGYHGDSDYSASHYYYNDDSYLIVKLLIATGAIMDFTSRSAKH